jgi:methylated-DNA-[protein]-cysteine S-methyltransferase
MRNRLLPATLFIDKVESPIGTILLIHDSEERLRALDFHDYEPRMRRLLRVQWGQDGCDFVIKNRPAPSVTRNALAGYFAGNLTMIDAVPVTTAGTSWQRDVWAGLREIRPGMTLSYGALARKLGHPNSVRAVGLANGANPIAIVVPCHRVIGTDGSLSGYGGGISRKRWLLTHEGADFDDKDGRAHSARRAKTPSRSKSLSKASEKRLMSERF